MPRTFRRIVASLLPALGLAVSAIETVAAQDLTIMAPAAPGGGWDQTARVMQQVLRATGLASNVQVTNVPGAAGTIGLARFVNAEAGNANTLLVMGLVMVSGIAMNASPVTLADVTPIARLSGEYEVIVVPAASPITSLPELVAAFRENPRQVSWGGGSAGGTDEILVRLLADAAGVPRRGVNYVAYSGGGQVLAAVLGGHVTAAVSGLGEFAAQLESGDLRAVAISASERLATPDASSSSAAPAEVTLSAPIPTFREEGFDVVLLNWRGVVAPPGIARDERRNLETTIERMSQSREWKDALSRNGWTDLTLVGAEFGRFLTEETRRVAPLVAGDGGAPRRDGFEILVLAALVLSLLAAGVQRRKRRSVEPGQYGSTAHNRNALLFVVSGVTLEAVLLRPAGFVLASAVMFTLVARAFGSRRVVRDAALGVVFAAIVFLAFARGLGVSLPAGPFG
ncbi:MAG TPA: tripartite tricarboxylate transporter substrate-binding protein [Gemmatimonadaceae bacterium]